MLIYVVTYTAEDGETQVLNAFHFGHQAMNAIAADYSDALGETVDPGYLFREEVEGAIRVTLHEGAPGFYTVHPTQLQDTEVVADESLLSDDGYFLNV